jgi:hypothetical protein
MLRAFHLRRDIRNLVDFATDETEKKMSSEKERRNSFNCEAKVQHEQLCQRLSSPPTRGLS